MSGREQALCVVSISEKELHCHVTIPLAYVNVGEAFPGNPGCLRKPRRVCSVPAGDVPSFTNMPTTPAAN